MRRGPPMRVFVATVGLVLMLASVPAMAGERSGVKGGVLDTTCPGPCSVNQEPRRFEGEADVVAHRRGEPKPVATTEVQKGRYRMLLRPGIYRLEVVPYPDSERPSCWEGSKRRVKIDPGEIERVRLTVQNVCVV